MDVRGGIWTQATPAHGQAVIRTWCEAGCQGHGMLKSQALSNHPFNPLFLKIRTGTQRGKWLVSLVGGMGKRGRISEKWTQVAVLGSWQVGRGSQSSLTQIPPLWFPSGSQGTSLQGDPALPRALGRGTSCDRWGLGPGHHSALGKQKQHGPSVKLLNAEMLTAV